MAAASQVPAGPWVNKGWIQEMIENLDKAVALGIVAATSETVATLRANLVTELATR